MSQKVMILVAKKHETWVDIVSTFGCSRTVAEDITQEMYYKIQVQVEKGLDIMYNDEINYYYIFKTLKSLYLDLQRRSKNISIISFDDTNVHNDNRQVILPTNFVEQDVNFQESYDIITEELNKMYWYDRKVFEIINGGTSIAELSRQSKIQYYTLYFTYTKVKKKLKDLL
tara:strand:- start:128 stop:640 length:513 start_codon:yes stop_codon:yes gene_type:complete